MDDARPPIFIVGCQRSGTTLLRLMLDSHPAISCGPETRFLGDLEKVTGEHWDRMSLYGFPREEWLRRIAAFFDSVHTDYARRRGKQRWADKTPRYALTLDFIDELFPDALIVHALRDGRDVVASHRDRWGYFSAVRAVEKWPRYVRTVRAKGAAVGPARYHEIRYEELVHRPEATLRGRLDFLGEPGDDAVLHHDELDHDVPSMYRDFTASRRATRRESTAVYRSQVGNHRRRLDPLLRLLFAVRAGRTLGEMGYREAPSTTSG